ncbi:MAG: hypothetical protein NTY48_03610 [Candidatus Diapherotrites archaeon]|nr:hypothetical protein [Candidatus Diapherotrites archaeon]
MKKKSKLKALFSFKRIARVAGGLIIVSFLPIFKGDVPPERFYEEAAKVSRVLENDPNYDRCFSKILPYGHYEGTQKGEHGIIIVPTERFRTNILKDPLWVEITLPIEANIELKGIEGTFGRLLKAKKAKTILNGVKRDVLFAPVKLSPFSGFGKNFWEKLKEGNKLKNTIKELEKRKFNYPYNEPVTPINGTKNRFFTKNTVQRKRTQKQVLFRITQQRGRN